MYIAERVENDVTLFTLGGRIDAENVFDLKSALNAAMAEGDRKMVLDMAEVRYIGSAGLQALIDVLARVRARGGDLKLVALSQSLLHTFCIVGFDRLFSLHDTLDTALVGF